MDYAVEVIKSGRYCYVNAVLSGERIGKVCVDMNPDDSSRYVKTYGGRFAKIVIVETSQRHTGKGIATSLLNKTLEVLKDRNLYLNVIPQKRTGNDMDRNRLIAFYSKFGFERYEADICTVTMVKKS